MTHIPLPIPATLATFAATTGAGKYRRADCLSGTSGRTPAGADQSGPDPRGSGPHGGALWDMGDQNHDTAVSSIRGHNLQRQWMCSVPMGDDWLRGRAQRG